MSLKSIAAAIFLSRQTFSRIFKKNLLQRISQLQSQLQNEAEIAQKALPPFRIILPIFRNEKASLKRKSGREWSGVFSHCLAGFLCGRPRGRKVAFSRIFLLVLAAQALSR